MGRSLLLGLEFLVAGDIIKTVAIEPTRESVIVLAVIVLVRTVLSLSIDVEIDGRWPWQAAGHETLARAANARRDPAGDWGWPRCAPRSLRVTWSASRPNAPLDCSPSWIARPTTPNTP